MVKDGAGVVANPGVALDGEEVPAARGAVVIAALRDASVTMMSPEPPRSTYSATVEVSHADGGEAMTVSRVVVMRAAMKVANSKSTCSVVEVDGVACRRLSFRVSFTTVKETIAFKICFQCRLQRGFGTRH